MRPRVRFGPPDNRFEVALAKRQHRLWEREHRARALAVLTIACLQASPACAEELAGPYLADVVRVIDGDTFEARIRIWLGQDLNVAVRIRDIAAPELRGRCPSEPEAAAAAREQLVGLLGSGPVSLINIRHDKYGRRVDAAVRLPSGEDVGAAMLSAGHARPSHRGRVSWCPEQGKRQGERQ